MTEADIRPITGPTPEMEALYSEMLGPGRFARTAYRIREQASANQSFGFNAILNEALIGTITLTPILVDNQAGAFLIGPLVIAKAFQGQGYGRALIEKSIETAKEKGFDLAILVGDPEFYKKSGFTTIPPGQIHLPGPVDPRRLLAREIEGGIMAKYQGLISAI